MRSPASMDILQIDVTSRCHESCSACTRHVGLYPADKHWEMDPDTFRRAVRSLDGWYQPGRVLGIIAGEPTLSKHFTDYCRILREEWNPGQDTEHGRAPIRDMNGFAHERLYDRSNGRGLWTAFGPKWQDVAEDVMDTFSHWNPNDHSEGTGLHGANLIDRKTLCKSLGISDEEWIRLRDNCWVQNTWSATITPFGAYFCEQAAHLDILFHGGKRGWPIEPGWWKRTPDQFGDQLDLCEMCSLALPAPSLVDSDQKDIVSESNRVALEVINSPAAKRGRLIDYDPAIHTEKRVITTKDSYVAPSGVRVSNTNKHVYGKRVAAVVTCVGYGDKLLHTMGWNAKQVDQLVIVTSTDDTETQEILREAVESCPNITAVASNRCHEDGDAFNKGKLINDGLRAVEKPDWIVLLDADVFLSPNFRQFCDEFALNPGVIYGTVRFEIDADKAGLYATGRPTIINHPGGKVNNEQNGYFQMFNRRAKALRGKWPDVMAETFCSAGGIDTWLLQKFESNKRVMIPGLPLVHIRHSGTHGDGWNGATAGERWRQFGMGILQDGKLVVIPTAPLPDIAAEFRITDTVSGEGVRFKTLPDGSIPTDILWADPTGLVFMGRNIGQAHLHMAYWG